MLLLFPSFFFLSYFPYLCSGFFEMSSTLSLRPSFTFNLDLYLWKLCHWPCSSMSLCLISSKTVLRTPFKRTPRKDTFCSGPRVPRFLHQQLFCLLLFHSFGSPHAWGSLGGLLLLKSHSLSYCSRHVNYQTGVGISAVVRAGLTPPKPSPVTLDGRKHERVVSLAEVSVSWALEPRAVPGID